MLFSTLTFAQKHTEYYDSSTINEIGRLKNGKRSGIWKFYHENEKLSKTGNLIYGKPEGQWKFYLKNGELKAVSNFKTENQMVNGSISIQMLILKELKNTIKENL
ncbi:MAG: hypothetical protein QNK89_09965 [Lacinutrix sp.]|uniref:toxin-antitoxin system YwqK family antitoxin n=1 Tax=Lacinutrix sp. TaxID=1937692 RepID=UPI0030A8028D